LQSKSIIEGLIRRHKYGSKYVMELESGIELHNSSVGYFSLPTSPSVALSRFEKKGEIPRFGDIWIPKRYTFLDCFIRFFILGVEKF